MTIVSITFLSSSSRASFKGPDILEIRDKATSNVLLVATNKQLKHCLEIDYVYT